MKEAGCWAEPGHTRARPRRAPQGFGEEMDSYCDTTAAVAEATAYGPLSAVPGGLDSGQQVPGHQVPAESLLKSRGGRRVLLS